MNDLNSILIEGRILHDPILTKMQEGKESFCRFTIKSEVYHKAKVGIVKEETSVGIEAWGRLAESCVNHGRKGRSVRVVGSLKTSSFEDLFIKADHIEIKPDIKTCKSTEETNL